MKIYQQSLPHKTALLVDKFLAEQPGFLKNFYLSGGTALSLLLGHRYSEDLDFFTQTEFDPINLQTQLESFGLLKNLQLASGTLNVYLEQVKLQFLLYPYPMLQSPVDWQGMKISSLLDVACTKLQTVSARGSKKDFIDLYFLLRKFSLAELFCRLDEKYPKTRFSKIHILKSLVYFVDADQQPMPKMTKSLSWTEVKAEMVQQAQKI